MEAIVAVYSDWGIGDGERQPLVIPEDRRHFAAVTKGAALIVGRRTLADFPGGKPLAGRANIVMTRQSLAIEGALVVHGAEEAASEAARHDRAFVVGGASVYRALLPEVERVYVTKIDARPESKVFFPNLDALPEWACTNEGEELMSNGVPYRFCVYERI